MGKFGFRLNGWPVATLAVCAVAIAVTACAPATKRIQVDSAELQREARLQRETAYRELIRLRERLRRVAFPVLAANADLCGEKVKPTFGFGYGSLADYSPEGADIIRAVEGVDSYEVAIFYVIPGSPAEKAGLKKGDLVLAIDGQDLNVPLQAPVSKRERRGKSEQTKRANEMMDASSNKSRLSFRVRRGTNESTITMFAVPVCDYPVRLVKSDIVNAFANGKQIGIHTGMVEFAREDIELATVVGHELAHNTMAHIDKSRGNAILGSVFDAIFAGVGVNTGGAFGNAAQKAYSQDFEAEADYVGLYYTARAGFDVSKAPYFWRRMAARSPGSIKSSHTASHPATPYRFLALGKTVEEILRKKKAGLPLQPDMIKKLPENVETKPAADSDSGN